jgi:nitronate monooxygenase
MRPEQIISWGAEFRAGSDGPFQMNLWIPDAPPARDIELEQRQCDFLGNWGPLVSPQAGIAQMPDFDDQCQAMLTVAPKVISSIMGLYPPQFLSEMKSRGIHWFATATTVTEAKAAEAAGADAIVAQGMEAGGHRGSFDPSQGDRQMVGLMALLPQVVDAVDIPVIATGGIADARQIAAALLLGASAVQMGTGFLRAPESSSHPAYRERLGSTEAHETAVTRAFSGRAGRAIANEFVRAAQEGPPAAAYPVQRGLTAAMRESARKSGDIERMQAWAGQSAKLAATDPAGDIVRRLWDDAVRILTFD